MTGERRHERAAGYRRDDDVAPAAGLARTTSSTRCARRPRAARPLPHTLTELTGPVLGPSATSAQLDHDLTRQHDGEPLGERIIVHGRVLDGDGRPVPQHAGRDLAGQRRRPLPPRRRPPPGAARPELLRRRARADRRRGPLPVRHHQAGRLPVEQPPQRLARRRTSTSRCSGRRSRSGWSPRCTSRATRSSARTRSSTRCRDPSATASG